MSAKSELFTNPNAELEFKHKMHVRLGMKKESPYIDQARKSCLLSKGILDSIQVPDMLQKFSQLYLKSPVIEEEISQHFISYKKDPWFPLEVVADNTIQGYAITWEDKQKEIFLYDHFEPMKYRLSIVATDAKRVGIGLQDNVEFDYFDNKPLYDLIQNPESGSVCITTQKDRSLSQKNTEELKNIIPILNDYGEFQQGGPQLQELKSYMEYRLFQYFIENNLSLHLRNQHENGVFSPQYKPAILEPILCDIPNSSQKH